MCELVLGGYQRVAEWPYHVVCERCPNSQVLAIFGKANVEAKALGNRGQVGTCDELLLCPNGRCGRGPGENLDGTVVQVSIATDGNGGRVDHLDAAPALLGELRQHNGLDFGPAPLAVAGLRVLEGHARVEVELQNFKCKHTRG